MAKRMTIARALEVVAEQMGAYCEVCDDETGMQCEGVPRWHLYNVKMEQHSNWCDEHKPEKEHFADFIEPFEGSIALDVIKRALAKAAPKKRASKRAKNGGAK